MSLGLWNVISSNEWTVQGTVTSTNIPDWPWTASPWVKRLVSVHAATKEAHLRADILVIVQDFARVAVQHEVERMCSVSISSMLGVHAWQCCMPQRIMLLAS